MYHYIVEFIDENEGKFTTDSGLVGADSWSAAVDFVVNYVAGNVVSVEIKELENPICEEEVLDMFCHEVKD